jgi:hypothetical protein
MSQLAEEFDQHVTVTVLWRAPTTQTLASQFLERTQQFALGRDPLAVGGNGALAFRVTVIDHDERISPFAGADAALGNGTSDVDVEVVSQVVDHSCLCQNAPRVNGCLSVVEPKSLTSPRTPSIGLFQEVGGLDHSDAGTGRTVPIEFTEAHAEALTDGAYAVDIVHRDGTSHHAVHSAEIAPPPIASWLNF